VSADIEDDPLIAQLPGDSARWAWIVTLTKGKHRTPRPGEWESEAHLTTALRGRGRHVQLFIKLGLLERRGQRVGVKNWEKWQTDPTARDRQARHRGTP
jgi:hypothetical protein